MKAILEQMPPCPNFHLKQKQKCFVELLKKALSKKHFVSYYVFSGLQ